VPDLHVVPEQQPSQSFVLHVPPQPFEAPLHSPSQSGTQVSEHTPLLQSSLELQVSQVPPFLPQ